MTSLLLVAFNRNVTRSQTTQTINRELLSPTEESKYHDANCTSLFLELNSNRYLSPPKCVVVTADALLACSMVSLFRRVLNTWEAYQVELHGRYVGEQLSELARYEHEASPLRAFAIVALTPVSCIAILVGADLMPLKSAYVGLQEQGARYWIRVVYTAIMVCITALTQCSHASPRLSLSFRTIGITAILLAPVVAVTFLVMHLVIGFPTPFSYSLETVPFQIIVFGALRTLWGSRLRDDIEARRDLLRFITFWLSQVCMLIIYPTMTFVFRTLSGDYQTLFALALPVVKMAIKNWAAYGAHRVEHITPVCVAFSVDVFHSLFVSCAMQSSTSLGTLSVVMVVDVFQSVIACVEVRQKLQRLQCLGLLVSSLEEDQTKPDLDISAEEAQPALYRAAQILSIDPQVRDHPKVNLPRHCVRVRTIEELRFESTDGVWIPQAECPQGNTPREGALRAPSIVLLEGHITNRVAQWARPVKVHAATKETKVTKAEQAKLYYVLDTMQLFYMVEFYLLIELTEVFVAVIYAIYLGAMFYLPNRYNYSHLKDLSDEQYISTLLYLLKYGAYELLSLLALAFAFRRMVRVSPLHQLGFTLQKNWRLAQALLVLTVFFPIQLSLDHTVCLAAGEQHDPVTRSLELQLCTLGWYYFMADDQRIDPQRVIDVHRLETINSPSHGVSGQEYEHIFEFLTKYEVRRNERTTTGLLVYTIMLCAIRRMVSVWEAWQVELHGRYSGDQLCELAQYERGTSSIKALVVVALAPVACIVILLVADLIPLQPAYLGLERQGPWYWIRVVYTSVVISGACLVQCSYASPRLPLAPSTIGLASLIIALVSSASFFLMHIVIGFPTPFSYSLETPLFLAIVFSFLWTQWGSILRRDGEAREDLARFGVFLACEGSMLIIYPAVSFVFGMVDRDTQTTLALCLPLLKTAIKNATAYGVYRVEHIAPVCVVFSTDLFHDLFVASVMRPGTSTGTFQVIMAVDVLQSIIAVVEVRQILVRLGRLRSLVESMEAQRAALAPHRTHTRCDADKCEPVLHCTVQILSTDELVHGHPHVKLPRHRIGFKSRLDLGLQSNPVTTVHYKNHSQCSRSFTTRFGRGSLSLASEWAESRRVHVVRPATEQTRDQHAELLYVLETMQLFYMVEFYLLIELTEVFVAVIYSMYLGVMFYLPNRYNYANLKTMSDDEFITTLHYMLKYTAYELLSLLSLSFVFRSMLKVSPLHQLGFTLQKNWRLLQTMIVLGVYFPVQLSLDHTGNDYSIKFAWLHGNNTIT